MIRSVIVEPWNASVCCGMQYDAFLSTIGYERRSRYIAEHLSIDASRKIASAFAYNHVLDFDANVKLFRKAGYETPEHSDGDFYRWAHLFIDDIVSAKDADAHLLIDLSSMSRQRIASLVGAIGSNPGDFRIKVDFAYALAEYSPPPKKTGPITNIGPVLPEFAGWFEDPGSPCSAIIGLGYDLGKAVGTIEYLGPGEIWAMSPKGEDTRYEEAVAEANDILIDSLLTNRIIDYDVTRPYETFHYLESLVSGILRDSRPVIVPFGPKVFTLCSLLVALMHHPMPSVWRVSSGKYEPVSNRIASGTVVGLRTTFSPRSE